MSQHNWMALKLSQSVKLRSQHQQIQEFKTQNIKMQCEHVL